MGRVKLNTHKGNFVTFCVTQAQPQVQKKNRILASGKFYLLIIHTFIHQLVWVSVN